MIDNTNNEREGNRFNPGDDQKAMVIGIGKFNQSRRIEQWARQSSTNPESHATQQGSQSSTIDPEAGDTLEEKVQAPLLDGGQGEMNPFICAPVEP